MMGDLGTYLFGAALIGAWATIISVIWTRRRKRQYYVVEEWKTFDDGNRKVWTTDFMTYEIADELCDILSQKAHEWKTDSWFKVVPYVPE